jgi:hypothetical protein
LCRAAFDKAPLPVAVDVWAAVREVADQTELLQREALLKQKQHELIQVKPACAGRGGVSLQPFLYYALPAFYLVAIFAIFGSLAMELMEFEETKGASPFHLTCPRLIEHGPFCPTQLGSLEVIQQCMEATKEEIESNSWYSTHWLHELAALQRAEVCIGKAVIADAKGSTAASSGSWVPAQ